MTDNKIFDFNLLSEGVVQIHGKVNGVAMKRGGYGPLAGRWTFNIRFFNDRGQLVKVSCGEGDGTIGNLKDLEERITEIYQNG